MPFGWLALEGQRAFAEWLGYFAAGPWLDRAPRGDGHPVLVIPGFLADDDSTGPLRRFLKRLGYSAHPWLLGRNLGTPGLGRERLLDRAVELCQRHERKLSLVGWSLGGIYARELAKRMPSHVRQVVTLGSPFADVARPTAFVRWFELVSGRDLASEMPELVERVRRPPPVPSTAIYSKTDGITHWEACREPDGAERENIEIPGSHCGLGFNPLVLWAIADRLAQPDGGWKPFSRDGWRAYLYR
ncbi:MAG TPA: alpha/beta hydrolase [Myxococcota bacterium]|nr:alpha/beta hydrolase [Myxococcota bacterium]